MCSGALVVLSRGRASTSHRDLCRLSCAVRAGGKAICCNDAMSATTPFFGTNSRRAARADRESVARLDALLETIVDQQEALLVRMLRGCAQAVVDAPLAEKPALRAAGSRAASDFNSPNDLSHTEQRPRTRDVLARSVCNKLCRQGLVVGDNARTRLQKSFELASCKTLEQAAPRALFVKEQPVAVRISKD